MKKVFALVAVVAAILVVGAACGVAQETYESVVAERDSAQAELQSVKSELDKVKSITLPEGYEQASPVIPAMGEHWANLAEFGAQAQAGLPMGPIYNVYKGEVIGIEYMWSRDMLQEITIPTPEGPEVFEALAPLPVGAIVDHMDITFVPEGHEGIYEVPHWDIHMYFITQEEKAAIMP